MYFLNVQTKYRLSDPQTIYTTIQFLQKEIQQEHNTFIKSDSEVILLHISVPLYIRWP